MYLKSLGKAAALPYCLAINYTPEFLPLITLLNYPKHLHQSFKNFSVLCHDTECETFWKNIRDAIKFSSDFIFREKVNFDRFSFRIEHVACDPWRSRERTSSPENPIWKNNSIVIRFSWRATKAKTIWFSSGKQPLDGILKRSCSFWLI